MKGEEARDRDALRHRADFDRVILEMTKQRDDAQARQDAQNDEMKRERREAQARHDVVVEKMERQQEEMKNERKEAEVQREQLQQKLYEELRRERKEAQERQDKQQVRQDLLVEKMLVLASRVEEQNKEIRILKETPGKCIIAVTAVCCLLFAVCLLLEVVNENGKCPLSFWC